MPCAVWARAWRVLTCRPEPRRRCAACEYDDEYEALEREMNGVRARIASIGARMQAACDRKFATLGTAAGRAAAAECPACEGHPFLGRGRSGRG